MEGIALGPDYPGNCYVGLPAALLEYRSAAHSPALQQEHEADVLEVLRVTRTTVLREEHFAALRVNWQPKPDNFAVLPRS